MTAKSTAERQKRYQDRARRAYAATRLMAHYQGVTWEELMVQLEEQIERKQIEVRIDAIVEEDGQDSRSRL